LPHVKVEVFKPETVPLISWEGILFQVTRWPWVVIGCLQGVLESLTNASYTFKVTPKEKTKIDLWALASSHIFLTLVSALAVLFSPVYINSSYRWLALLDVIIYTFATIVIVVPHSRESSANELGNKIREQYCDDFRTEYL
jgi:hypothetical protein